MSKEMWLPVKKFSNGESLDANTLNVPIGQLGDRTAYLYNRLRELLSHGKMASVLLTDVGLDADDIPEVGNVVYLDNDSHLFAKAKASMSLYDDFTAADSAFTVGILQSRDGGRGTVIAYGRMDLDSGGDPVKAEDMLESGEEFRPGRYYLSANEAGKLTANPTGPLIYVCTIDGSVSTTGSFSGDAIVNPQYLDIGTSHVHRAATLTARPAGTLSIYGYLPETYDSSSPESGLALRFGGTWTPEDEKAYAFYIDQESVQWPNPVALKWTVNGEHSDDFVAYVHAPDEEVEVADGLTVRLSIPMSSASSAFSGLSSGQRTWPALEFPDAGKGWTAHAASAVAETDDVQGLKVALRGKIDASPSTVKVAFPEQVQVLTLGSIASGSEFVYGDHDFVFTTDAEAYSGDGTPVQLGSCLADSALYLAAALRGSGETGEFAVYEANSGSSAKLLVMDGLEVQVDGTVVTLRETVAQNSFSVVGAQSINFVLFDGEGRALGDSPVFTNAKSYCWNKAAEDGLSVMIYQTTTSSSLLVPAGTVVSAQMFDDDPEAIYDYVIGLDQQIAMYWPPVPPKSAALMVNGVEMDNKALLPDNPTVSFGNDTIHWFEDDAGRKPWPEELQSRDAAIDPSLDKTEVMHWVRSFQGATGPVTSIQAKEGSVLKIFGYGTNKTANTGDLVIDAAFDFRIENGGAAGYNVPKRARGGKLVAGPVVEKIIGGPGVSVISRAGCPEGQGTVMVALDNGTYRSQFSDIALENAEQAKIGMFPYIRLKGYTGQVITSPSAFTATMRVPTNLPDAKYALRLFASVFGEIGFSGASRMFACVKMAYNVLPDFSATGDMMYRNLKTSLLKPDSDRTVLIPFGHSGDGGAVYSYNGYDPVLVTTEGAAEQAVDDIVEPVLGKDIPSEQDFREQLIIPDLRPGYLVGVRFSRAVTQTTQGGAYTSPIGFINMSWELVSAES